MIDTAAPLDANDFLFRGLIAYAHGHGDRCSAHVCANLENVAHADFGAVVKHDNRVDAEHGTIGRFHELMMQSFLLAILDQLSHQLETVTDIGVGVQPASLGC